MMRFKGKDYSLPALPVLETDSEAVGRTLSVQSRRQHEARDEGDVRIYA